MHLARLFPIGVFALLLAACMPTAPSVDISLLNSLTISDVVVEVDGMGDRESVRDVLKASGIDEMKPESSEFLKTPEGRKRVNEAVADIIKKEFKTIAAERLKGSVNARLIVRADRFDVQRTVFGVLGGGPPQGSAVVTLLDAKTGRIIATSPELKPYVPGAQSPLQAAVGSIMQASQMADPNNVRLAKALAASYFNWLLQPR